MPSSSVGPSSTVNPESLESAHDGRYWRATEDRSVLERSPDAWITRDPQSDALIRLTGPFPLNAEAPVAQLLSAGLITPTPLHYVRNHGPVPRLSAETHQLEIDIPDELRRESPSRGDATTKYTVRQLRAMTKLSVAVTLTCDGNRRKEVNSVRRSNGFDWGAGATGTAIWTGVSLRNLLIDAGIDMDRVAGGSGSGGDTQKQQPWFLLFEGADQLAKGTYGTSIPLPWALDEQRDMLVAYDMNDAQLPPDHGAPLRVVLPGMVGGRQVKWLTKMTVSREESQSWYHFHDNRVLPSGIDSTSATKDIWRDPKHLLYDLNINSVIATPRDGTWVDVLATTHKQRITGYAYSGGGRAIIAVELSLNMGESWFPADFKYPDASNENDAGERKAALAPRHGGKRWTWCHWSVEMEVWRLMNAAEVWVRAIDCAHNTQPHRVTWNLLGMMNNAIYRVQLNVREFERTEPGQPAQGARPWLQFRHPVCPGSEYGGWMHIDASAHENTAHLAAPSALSSSKNGTAECLYTKEEVAKHNTIDNCWIIIDGGVYDLTPYVQDHPGGPAPLLMYAGGDASKVFRDIHGKDAYGCRSWYRIGTLLVPIPSSTCGNDNEKPHYLLSAKVWTLARLIEKKNITDDTLQLVFDLAAQEVREEQERSLSARLKCGLPIGKHVLLAIPTVDGKLDTHRAARPYTPIRPTNAQDDGGYIELIVKVYRASGHHPAGQMSSHLDGMTLGQTILMKGPAGGITYQGGGYFLAFGRLVRAECINLVGGGTGITPLYQVVRAVLAEANAEKKQNGPGGPRVALLYANHAEADIMLDKELRAMADAHPTRFRLFYTVSQTPEHGDWIYGEGHVNVRMMARHLYKASDHGVSFVCGPPSMVEHALLPSLRELGFNHSNTFEF
ncbi:hypothetical protein HDU86_006708 [Geranomyces michiganensis]|nr:hypothetical protein HDU86_006708 [Geranomyces michiganensis]